MSELKVKTRVTYQAPVPGSRIRTRKADAYADWAYALVGERLRERCGCEPGSDHESPWTCAGHRGTEVPRLDWFGEDTGETETIHHGIFNAGVRADMRRRVAAMLKAGWRP